VVSAAGATEPGATIDVSVRGIASGGAGVADLPDGRIVFVPRTLPGDRVRIRLVRDRPRWATAEVDRVVEPSPDRVAPPCPVYARCGGCQLQHVPYADQLAWKGRFVADALARIGGLEVPAAPEVVPSPQTLEYRSRISPTLRRLRSGRVVAGFHALGSPARITDVEACLLAEPALMSAWRSIRGGWGPGARHLPAGGSLRLTLRSTGGGVELLVEGGVAGWEPKALLKAAPLSAVWHRPDDAGTEEAVLLAGVEGTGGGVAFEQVNREAAELLQEHVLGRIERLCDGPGRAVDAYCGAGAYGRALASKGWSVVGIERSHAAVEAARRGAPEGFVALEGAVEARLGEALPADLIVMNPPRTGLDVAVADRLVEDPVDRVVYASCDPGTLARDLGRLSGRYELVDLAAFDLFPQTAHVETVVVLSRRAGLENSKGATS
jgi:23S rRNA (uracil1939-C5)-methyltransferase